MKGIYWIIGIIAVVVIGGGVYLATKNQTPLPEGEDAMMEEKGDAMMEKESDAMMKEDGAMMEKEEGAMMEEGAMEKPAY